MDNQLSLLSGTTLPKGSKGGRFTMLELGTSWLSFSAACLSQVVPLGRGGLGGGEKARVDFVFVAVTGNGLLWFP